MSLLYRIVYAAHANGTHHKLALDALKALTVPDAERWERVFLAHAEGYMTGAKAPDNTFKDFKNHVLHVGENYWGGAIDKVEEWYATTVAHLAQGQWADAVYAAGVLSHYYTDPIHPFHTAQSEAENSIHRAAEWSINRSYDALARMGAASNRRIAVAAKDGDGWLRDLVCAGAELSNAQYEKLIAHYDIHKGVVDPPAGLDMLAQALVADLIDYAGRSFGLILDRAILASRAAPPPVSLTVETFLATVKIPKKWIAKKLANAADRKIVEAMYDELRATGHVDKTLPEDDRVVRDLHAAEVLAPRQAARDRQRAALVGRTAPPAPAAPASTKPEPGPKPAAAVATLAGLKPKPSIMPAPAVPPAPVAAAQAPATQTGTAQAPVTKPAEPTARPAEITPAAAKSGAPPQSSAPPQSLAARLDRATEPSVPIIGSETAKPATLPVQPAADKPEAKPAQASAESPPKPATASTSVPPVAATPPPVAPQPSRPTEVVDRARPERSDAAASPERSTREPRIYLAATDPLEAAPSIGPKGAARFAAFGVQTVGDFLAGDAKDMATKLAIRQVTPEVIAAWQAQARLVMSVPGLRGTHAQLLTGAGYRTAAAIASADAEAVCAAVLKYATSSDGQRILRDGPPPDVERIKSWCDSARAAVAA